MAPTPLESPVQTLFNRIAPVYDRLNQVLSFGQHRIWKQMAVKWTQPQPGHQALDLCCGSGDVALMLADRVGPFGKVYGVDFSCDLLDIARTRAQQAPGGNRCQWIQGDVLALPFETDTIDCATMSYGLRNVTDIPKSLAELHRVLKPGAKFAILDMHRPANPLVRSFQQWYLETLVVPAAKNLGFTEEYAYIGPSLDRFPTGPEQVALAQAAGFNQVVHYPIAEGTMGVLVGTK
jgi:demethylphylloquinol methyltransferase